MQTIIIGLIASGVIGVTLAIGAFLILGKKIGSMSKKFVFSMVELIFKNEELKSNIFKKFKELEDEFGTDAGKAKMDAFCSWAGKFIAGDLDDKIYRQLCQGLYEGWKSGK